MTVWINHVGAASDHYFEANDAACLVGGLHGPIEDLSRMHVRRERLALDDADRCQHAEPIGTGELIAFPVHKQLELIEGAAVADRQHVDGDPGGIGELHSLGASFAVQRIDLSPFNVGDGSRQILRVGFIGSTISFNKADSIGDDDELGSFINTYNNLEFPGQFDYNKPTLFITMPSGMIFGIC